MFDTNYKKPRNTYSFEKMQIGDSQTFYIDFAKSTDKVTNRVSKALGYKFKRNKIGGDLTITRIA